MISDLYQRAWWMLLARGAAAGLFALALLLWPRLTLAALALLFGVYALSDGVACVSGAMSGRQVYEEWRLVRLQGFASIALGAAALARPHITAGLLLFLVAVRALAIGSSDSVAGVILWDETRHEWLLPLGGIVSLLVGLGALIRLGSGALASVWLIAIGSLAVAAPLVALALRMRNTAGQSAATITHTG